jgi:hypothetical protein
MVKIFIGNVAPGTEEGQLRELFEECGAVSECAVVGNYAFIHMDDKGQAERAISSINGKDLNGQPLSVEMSHGKKRDGGGPMRGRGGRGNGNPRGRGGPPRGAMIRGGRPGGPGFRPRPWESDGYASFGQPAYAPRGPVPLMRPAPPRGALRGGPAARGMSPRGMIPIARGARGARPPVAPVRAMRGGRGSLRPRPTAGFGSPYIDDGSGMLYADASVIYEDGSEYYADPNVMAADPAMGAGGEYDYYGGADYGVQDPGVYDAYSTADYTGAEGYDQPAYYGEYVYEYAQDPSYAAPAANGVRYNPYAAQ